MKTKSISPASGPERQRQQLAAWLVERRLDQWTADHDETFAPRTALRYDQAAGVVRRGEIYMLRPLSGGWEPVYVLVVDGSGSDGWLVVPFGRYATPAVPGEWRTGMAASPLRVLCGWNIRTLATDRFLPGAVKIMSAKMLDETRALYGHITRGEAVSARLASRLGPPIIHPADPRYEYLDEERQRLDDHTQPAGNIILFEREEAGASNWLKAAEGRPRYGDDKTIK